MGLYKVYGIMTASSEVGEYEANGIADAIAKANDDPNADWSKQLCHHCAGEVELGDVYELQASEVE